MKSKRSSNIQSKLFSTYTIIIVSMLMVISLIYFIGTYSQFKTRIFNDIYNTSVLMSQKMDDEIQNMDTVSVNVCYSNLVKKRFENYSKDPSSSGSIQRNNSEELTDMLTAIIGPNRSAQQIYVSDFSGHVFGSGFDNRELNDYIETKNCYNKILNNNGKKYVAPPEKRPELSSMIARSSNMYFLSLYRVYFDNSNTKQGVVEVIQYCDKIFSSLNDLVGNNALGESVYVFNSDGQQIYPYSGGQNGSVYFKKCKATADSKFEITDSTNKKKLVTRTFSNYTGWTTMVVSDENVILSSFFPVQLFALFVTVIIFLVALMFSFYASKTFTKPIKALMRNMRKTANNDKFYDIPDINSGVIELEELNESFRNMSRKIQTSVNEKLLSQKNETNAKILALQSQMNPHFLYNSLATISAMAEENLDDEIVSMCDNMCDMLRYISSDISKFVTIGTEMENTCKYIECLKLRFYDRLNCTVVIDDNIKNIEVPKLIVQPLVENAIKYASVTNKFIAISIKGYKTDDSLWRIEVADNGPGFTDKALSKINEKIDEIDRKGLLPSLKIDGMGLINIYLRLKIIYKDKTHFKIGRRINPDDSTPQTVIEIGGSAQFGKER